MEFEWDEAKADRNLLKHGVSFDLACLVFRDAFASELCDSESDPEELRYVLTGSVEGTILTVVYTERADRIRLISARKATTNEQREYYLSQSAE